MRRSVLAEGHVPFALPLAVKWDTLTSFASILATRMLALFPKRAACGRACRGHP